MDEATDNETSYRVLARKYRPNKFDDLIGQEPMVTTLTNAFELNRIAQAYMLTGVRGVGKTTTARILARALNYKTETIDKPTIHLTDMGVHCEAIIQSNHLDVIEMDAASHTGIDDIREIIDAVKYKPAAARYKVYIIDEVHMLSKSAFNGLLKTLEEPPAHVKFIFATTEIRKVPVTILSRCQRFDLRRIEDDGMISFLKEVAEKEQVSVHEEALSLVARASEGSVRDALSLLDQAISHGAGAVSSEQMRDMLGLADRSRIIDLFEHVMSGRVADALSEIKAQYDIGADPYVILCDLADFTHLVTTAKLSGGIPRGQALSDLERNKAEEFAARLSVRILSRAWQMLLTGVKEVETARKPLAAADMVIVRLAYVADLPTPDEALRFIKQAKQGETDKVSSQNNAAPEGGSTTIRTQQNQTNHQIPSLAQAPKLPPTRPVLASTNASPATPSPAPMPQRRINRFEDFVALAEEHRDLPFRHALETHVCLVDFTDGRIEFVPTQQAPRDLASTMKQRLKQWSGCDWQVIVSRDGGALPLKEQREHAELERTREAEEDPVVAAVLKQFPGSKIVNISFCDEEAVLDASAGALQKQKDGEKE